MKLKIAIGVIFLPVILYILFFVVKERPGISYDKNVILDNEVAYTSIAKLCYENYCKNGLYDDIYTYAVDYNDKVILCYHDNNKIYLSDRQFKNYEIIKSTYRLDKQIFDRIYVYDTFVTFANENGRSSFIYSVNKEEPIYINRPDDDNTDIYVEKITDNWYYACVHGRLELR